MKTSDWYQRLVIAVIACAASVVPATVHAQAGGNRAQQSSQIQELGETLRRAGASQQRLIAIVQGMTSAATTAEQMSKIDVASNANEALSGVDCQLTQVWGMLVMYDAMTHEPDRRRVAPNLSKMQDSAFNGAQRQLSLLEARSFPKLAGSPAGDAATESLRELRKAAEMLRAIKL